jgi:hypothetical protein
MKKYKTWEVIKMLTENPTLRFKTYEDTLFASTGGYIYFERKGYGKDCGAGRLEGNVYLTEEWELIQQPIPIQEAARLFDEERRTVRCEYPDCNNKTKVCKDTFKPNNIGGMRSEDEITFYMINHGTWYVEDSNE